MFIFQSGWHKIDAGWGIKHDKLELTNERTNKRNNIKCGVARECHYSFHVYVMQAYYFVGLKFRTINIPSAKYRWIIIFHKEWKEKKSKLKKDQRQNTVRTHTHTHTSPSTSMNRLQFKCNLHDSKTILTYNIHSSKCITNLSWMWASQICAECASVRVSLSEYVIVSRVVGWTFCVNVQNLLMCISIHV